MSSAGGTGVVLGHIFRVTRSAQATLSSWSFPPHTTVKGFDWLTRFMQRSWRRKQRELEGARLKGTPVIGQNHARSIYALDERQRPTGIELSPIN